MLPLLSLVSIAQSAMSVIGSFTGQAHAAKLNGQLQDAVSVVNAVTPLINQFASGTEVTEEQVRAALAGKDTALASFDAEIARQSAG